MFASSRVRAHLTFILSAAIASVAAAQSIYPVAGGVREDGRPATLAELNLPSGVALDQTGILYIADTANDRVRSVDLKTQLAYVIAGTGQGQGLGFSGDGGPATLAALSRPADVAVDALGNIYVADALNRRIRKIERSTGIIRTVAGNGSSALSGDGGPATLAGLTKASSVAVDEAGNLYVADEHRVRKVSAATGIISTIAGTGVSGFSGDGGPATLATLSSPESVAVDTAGNLYIGDGFLNGRLRRVAATSGTISTLAGGGSSTDDGPVTAARLALIRDVDIDRSGNLYLTDGNRIRVIRSGSGIISTVAGNGVEGSSGDNGPATKAMIRLPEGIIVDDAGNLFIADSRNHRVRFVSGTSGNITTLAGRGTTDRLNGDGGPASAARLSFPSALAVGPGDHVYVADDISRVRKIDAETGKITTYISNLSEPQGVAADRFGNVYVSDTNTHRVLMRSAAGSVTTYAGNFAGTFAGDGGPATQASLKFPAGLATDQEGNLYIADRFNSRIRKVDRTTRIISTVAGNGGNGSSGDGGAATAAEIGHPFAMAVDRAGNLYFGTRKVTAATGIITRFAEGLQSVSGIAIDGAGNVFIAEQSEHRIRRIEPSGIIRPHAGTGISGWSGDDGPASRAQMNRPVGLALDSNGNLYFSDEWNDRVRGVGACVTLSAPDLTSPAGGSTGVSVSPRLSWKRVVGATRYDVLLDTVDPPVAIAGSDLASTSFGPTNLTPLTTYYWRVVAKGDPYCTPRFIAESAVRAFTTRSECSAPGEGD